MTHLRTFHLKVFTVAALLAAFLVLPSWAGQAAGQDAAPQDAAPAADAGAADTSPSGFTSWWNEQESWQIGLYVLGVVAVVLVVLQIRYHWIEAIPGWIKSSRIFFVEVKGEWGKVTKPSKNEVIQTTIVVVVVSFIFAVYLWAADQVILKAYQWTFESLGL